MTPTYYAEDDEAGELNRQQFEISYEPLDSFEANSYTSRELQGNNKEG